MSSEVAERYGNGLYELACENNTVESKKEQAETLLEALEESDELLLFLQAVKVTNEEKKDKVVEIFKDTLDKDMINLIRLLVDRDRTWYLKDILRVYIGLADEKLGIQKAEVFSARKLSEEDLQRIKDALGRKENKKIILRNIVDPSLIAGIKVKVGNNVTDITMKTQIENLRQALLKGGNA
ncbi:MAG: ATP synthase F1 subunit delta [Lactimicrobium sp.]|jgi:F-type H+-transporting ATPase subunit delta|uniref:ATP synthase F1 subunit delta n=1 Tax=Lactimicrobium sp. TaxID=2563780 RepID=UPI002F352753